MGVELKNDRTPGKGPKGLEEVIRWHRAFHPSAMCLKLQRLANPPFPPCGVEQGMGSYTH